MLTAGITKLEREAGLMRTIRVIADLTYDDYVMHDNDAESEAWFIEHVLLDDELIVHSNEIGDTLGTMKVREIVSEDEDDG